MNTIRGDELDGRLFTDLSGTEPESLLTPTSRFYIRTRASHLLPHGGDWKIRIRSGGRSSTLAARDAARRAKPVGTHLLECAGNTRAAHFGMISIAEWGGVPLSAIFDRFGLAGQILVSGFDQYEERSLSSVPGASWIFRERDLRSAGAFLATAMNGAPIPPDHGAPVRLVVPGWYGCCCIKWVNEIAAVGDRAETTSQMVEYAERTHQHGKPGLALEYEPAVIDFAAMPVRVEKWSIKAHLRYRIIGITWGGHRARTGLLIRFNPNEQYVQVSDVRPLTGGLRAYWTHWWTPSVTGVYQIQLRAADPTIRTRRLNFGYYTRSIEISDV